MSEKVAKRKRREAKANGEFKAKQFFKPYTVPINGVETYIPRKERRKVMRQYRKLLMKGMFNVGK